MEKFAAKFVYGLVLMLGLVFMAHAAVVSWYGAGAADDVRFMIGNYLSGEADTFAQTEKVFHVMPGPWEREEVASSATDQSLGTAGSTGDYLDHCNCQVTTSGATGTCGIEDGTNTAFDDITAVPASSPVGLHTIWVQSQATTAAGWEVTTGAAATMQCYGRFDTAGD